MSVIFLMILFVILSPGMFLSIPPIGGRVWMTGKMSLRAVFVHAAVFAVILYIVGCATTTEGFAPNVTPQSADWMITKINAAKNINDPNIKSIVQRFANEVSAQQYGQMLKSIKPQGFSNADIANMEAGIKALKEKRITPAELEDINKSVELMESKVMPELLKKFGNSTNTIINNAFKASPMAISSQRVGNLFATSMPQGNMITQMTEFKESNMAVMPPSGSVMGGYTMAPIIGGDRTGSGMAVMPPSGSVMGGYTMAPIMGGARTGSGMAVMPPSGSVMGGYTMAPIMGGARTGSGMGGYMISPLIAYSASMMGKIGNIFTPLTA